MFKNTTKLYKLLKDKSKNYNKLPELYNLRDISCIGTVVSFFADENDNGEDFTLKIRHVVNEENGLIYEYLYDEEDILLETEIYESVDALEKQFESFRKTIAKYVEV